MAEYYPLLAKAVASLPNSTQDSRKVVYERARKALIGQLRTLHPPVPDEDIARESDALDRAVERLETELAAATPFTPTGPAGAAPPPAPFVPPRPAGPGAAVASPSPKAQPDAVVAPVRFPPQGGALGPSAGKPFSPLRTKVPSPKTPVKPALDAAVPNASATETPSSPASDVVGAAFENPASDPARPRGPDIDSATVAGVESRTDPVRDLETPAKARPEPQRPFAPQPPKARGAKRPLWIIPLGIAVVVLLVGFAAYKLRDKPNLLTRVKPTDQATDTSKIVERVGGDRKADPTPRKTDAPASDPARPITEQAATNPAAAVAGRAALLVEAPDDPANKVKTYLGTVVWRLDNVSDGQNQTVGIAVRADIDLPDDKLKATVLFQKNVEASLPASHTMKVRFMVMPGSATGNVKQINVPQMRKEDSGTGDSLDGVSVTIVDNSFLIGLTPGNSETANLDMLRAREWIDIPILLTNSKIAKLTFEKTAAGQRDIQDAIAAWTKQ